MEYFYKAILAILMLGAVAYVPAQAATCFGANLTMSGTPGNDTIVGTSRADVIATGEGNDVIEGRDGNDRMCAGPGSDALKGQAGGDYYNGGDGNDSCNDPANAAVAKISCENGNISHLVPAPGTASVSTQTLDEAKEVVTDYQDGIPVTEDELEEVGQDLDEAIDSVEDEQ